MPSGIDQLCVHFGCIRSQYIAMNGYNNLGLTSVAVTLLLFLGGCNTAPSGHRGTASLETLDVPSRISQGQANDITIYAVGLVGTPYRYGGNTPDSGVDCSGLIGYVYQTRAGVAPPRTYSRMQNWGQPVSSDNIRSGELL